MSSTKLIILITIFYIVLFNYSVLAIEDEFQIQLKQEEQQNNDDTSLFREVENVIDEDSDEDAYRMLKSLQEVSEDEVEDEQEEEFENNVNELYNNEKSTTTNNNNNNDNNEEEQLRDEIHNVNENDNSLSNEEDELIINDEEDPLTTDENEEEEEEEFDDDEEEDEEEEDDDDLSPDFPEFQNEATTEFFENLPKQPMDNIDSKINSGQDTIEDEELDEEIDELEPDQEDDEEDQEEDINKEIEIKEKEEKDQVQVNHNIPNSPSFDDSIPWQRPDSGRFYQDIRVKDTNPKQNSERSYKFWYLFLLSVVLTLLYRSLSHRPNGMIELSTATSSNSAWSRDEKDYLPLHNGNKRNSYYKNEIKSS